MSVDAKKTLVLGASPNPARYAYQAVRMLRQHGHEVVAVGRRRGDIGDVTIRTDAPPMTDLDTLTLYVGPQNQPPLYDYILGLKPRRVIFNPGTENPELATRLRAASIEPVQACTLVMLSVGNY